MNTWSKRSLKTLHASGVLPLRNVTNNSNPDLPSKRKHRRYELQEETMLLLRECFSKLSENVWWRILPVEDDFDDISVGMGIHWEDLLPLLLHTGLLYTEKRSTVNRYMLNHFQWQTFCIEFN